MKTVVAAYAVAYSLLHVVLFAVERWLVPPDERDPLWETIADSVLAAVGLAGMVFYLRDVESESLRSVWKAVSVALAISVLWLNARGRTKSLSEEGEEVTSAQVISVDVAFVLVILPALVVNLIFAYW